MTKLIKHAALVGTVLALAVLAVPAVALADPIQAASVTQETNFFGWCGGKTPLQEIQPDATPPAVPGTCGNFTNNNGTITVQLGAAQGQLTVSEYASDSGTRPASVTLYVDGTVKQSLTIPASSSGWLSFAPVPVQTTDTVQTYTWTNYTGTGQVKVQSVHGDLTPNYWDSATTWSPNSYWEIPPFSAVDPQSATYVNDLLGEISKDGVWVNTYAYSTPVFVVPANEPTVKVTLRPNPNNPDAGDLAADYAAVPIPPNAQPASGTDGDMVIYQPSQDRFWDFWHMTPPSGGAGWTATWGGYMGNVSQSNGLYPNGPNLYRQYYGTRATGLPLMGGLITAADIARGSIDHALVMQIPSAQASCFNIPAWRTDGNGAYNSTLIPEGLEFTFPPLLNISALGLPKLPAMIATAIQKYGVYVADQGGAVAFFGEDTVHEGLSDIWQGPGGAFDNTYPDQNNLFKNFPWQALQAVDPPSPYQYCGWQIPW